MIEGLLRSMFAAAVAAAQAERVLPAYLPPPPLGRTVMIGFGKAAASMVQVAENNWSGPVSGLVVTRYGHAVPCRSVRVVEAAHPVPDAAGQAAAAEILEMVQGLGADDLVLCLISGGGSALLTLPAKGLTLQDKQAVSQALLRSGATISEMNCVRKHLSAVKGGRLAAAAFPASVVSLAISDVPGDDPAVIASGPTVADPTTFSDARGVLAKYGVTPPEAVIRHLAEAVDETPKPGDKRLSRAQTSIVARPQESLEAAAEVARAAGYTPVILGDSIEGEARDVARDQARLAMQRGGKASVLLSGGETTVTLKGSGRGGRNAEFLLALAVALNGHPRIWAAACDTDGIDGTEDNAGAVLRPDTLSRAAELGLDANAMLENNDGYGFFSALDDLIVTGPTQTNVNDFRAIVIEENL